MTPPRTPTDNSLLSLVLTEVRNVQEKQEEFRCDIRDELRLAAAAREEFQRTIRDSMRVDRACSEDFRDEMRNRVGQIEITLAESRGSEKATKNWGAVAGWAIGTLIAVGAILIPLLWGKL